MSLEELKKELFNATDMIRDVVLTKNSNFLRHPHTRKYIRREVLIPRSGTYYYDRNGQRKISMNLHIKLYLKS